MRCRASVRFPQNTANQGRFGPGKHSAGPVPRAASGRRYSRRCQQDCRLGRWTRRQLIRLVLPAPMTARMLIFLAILHHASQDDRVFIQRAYRFFQTPTLLSLAACYRRCRRPRVTSALSSIDIGESTACSPLPEWHFGTVPLPTKPRQLCPTKRALVALFMELGLEDVRQLLTRRRRRIAEDALTSIQPTVSHALAEPRRVSAFYDDVRCTPERKAVSLVSLCHLVSSTVTLRRRLTSMSSSQTTRGTHDHLGSKRFFIM